MVRPKVDYSGILSAKEVQERNDRCAKANLCFVSLKPLTDENKFTLFTTTKMEDGSFQTVAYNMLKQYGEAAVGALSK